MASNGRALLSLFVVVTLFGSSLNFSSYTDKRECAQDFPISSSSDPRRTWEEYCQQLLHRQCTEPTSAKEDMPTCEPCSPNFKEDPFYPGEDFKACIEMTKCNEIKSDKTTWTRYCGSLHRKCAEPKTSDPPKCSGCLDNYLEDPAQKGNVDKPCTEDRRGCKKLYDESKPKGGNWKKHCHALHRVCTSRSDDDAQCGDCLEGYKAGPTPDEPCESGAAVTVAQFITSALAFGLAGLWTRF